MKNKNIKFIFRLIDKKIAIVCLLIEAFLDIIYYTIPFTFSLFLTLPFTVEKAIFITSIFISSKLLRAFVLRFERKIMDNYLYNYSNLQYEEYYRNLTKVPVETLSNYQTGYLENIIEKISSLVSEIIGIEYIGIILSFVFFFYTIFQQSIPIFIVSLILSMLCVLISVFILKKSNKSIEELYDKEYEYSSIYQDFISNIRTVKALNNDKYFENIIHRKGQECYTMQRKYVNVYSFEELIRNILILLPFALGLIKAVIDLSNGIDTLGIITFYITLSLEMGFIFEELSRNIISWFELSALKKKANILFKEVDERKVLKNFEKIVLSDISIKYKEALFDISINSLEINKNDKICITGRSGQGKTSILNLILGNLKPNSGNIYIDDKNIEDYILDIGVVSQEIELFNMTIKDNLCLGKKLSDEELINYLEELDLKEILLLEEGIYTFVGEKGLKLSTGQKRRINILRSYLMNKNIYILDEPTSNLDKMTEDVVVKFILKYFTDKTLIIATHNEQIKQICNSFYEMEGHQLKKIKV